MPSHSTLHAVRMLALASLLTPASALALDQDDYKTLSHVLAVGLPAVAGGISIAKDDTAGLLQLAKSEAGCSYKNPHSPLPTLSSRLSSTLSSQRSAASP